MQFFGKINVIHELEYLTKSYIYIPHKDDNREDITIDTEQLNLLIKKKSKNVAGTIFLFNPENAPLGHKLNEKLQYQGFKFDSNFHELEIDQAIRILGRSLKKYRGKLIEVKYLFNYLKEDIQPTTVLEIFDMDLEKVHTNQLTVFAKDENFQDYKNISYNGSFIFFAWGHKFDRHHTNISTYASNIAQWAKKAGKEIGFVYDKVKDSDESFEYTRFIHPVNFGKLKLVVPSAIETVFARETIAPYRI
ncbi:MAG: hypothetical protein U9N59_02885 [Campylobacterota bacterium]|nr:hypothetical protein [Campylobacterota bacterium]